MVSIFSFGRATEIMQSTNLQVTYVALFVVAVWNVLLGWHIQTIVAKRDERVYLHL
jgi:hypothetical protein